MYVKNIYFSGGNFYELQEIFSRVRGVTGTKAGYINSLLANPRHEDVLCGQTGAALGVKVLYNPKKIDLSTLLDVFCTVVNPYLADASEKAGNTHRKAIYYTSYEDEPVIQFYMNFVKSRRIASVKTPDSFSKPLGSNLDAKLKCYMEALPLQNFYEASKIYQHYLRKNPNIKTNIDFARLQELKIIAPQ